MAGEAEGCREAGAGERARLCEDRENLRLRKGDLGGMKLWGLCELWLDRGGVVEVEMVSVGGE